MNGFSIHTFVGQTHLNQELSCQQYQQLIIGWDNNEYLIIHKMNLPIQYQFNKNALNWHSM